MSGWHSLSGYLQYKSGNNALGRLITKRKVWCILEESKCQLLMYKSEDDAHKHCEPYGHIDIHGAAISLDLEHSNQFVITSEKKEHVFTAQNHESMMIWLLGLQAKRDLYSRKAPSSDKSHLSNSPSDQDYEVWNDKPSLYMTYDQHHDSLQKIESIKSSGSLIKKEFHWDDYSVQRIGESVDSGIHAPKKVLESSKSFPVQRCSSHMTESSRSSVLFPTRQSFESDSDDVFGREMELHLQKGRTLSHNWRKLQQAVLGPGAHSSKLSFDNLSEDIRRSSSRSASSDSAIERGEGTPQELLSRLAELERELISTKCELAKVLNRQTCYQELLLQKDDTIKHLEEQSSDSGSKTDSKKNKSLSKLTKAEKEFQEKVRVLQNQNRFLNEEVKKLARLRQDERGQFQEQNLKLQSLEADIEKWKMDYVSLIQSSIRYPCEEGMEDVELSLYGGDKHKKRVQALLEEARKINPRLPTYESLASNEVHVDAYGFKHIYTNTGLLLHYLCTELTHHYLIQAGVYEEHQKKWTAFMRQHGKQPMMCVSELKPLCRGGIPDRFRKQMWRHMVQFKVRNLLKEKGDHYYRNLCNMLPDSPVAACYRKQVALDLMRTMPNNTSFSSPGSKGIMDLQDVLLAFCIHNPTIGYCQGMNFIVGMSLIFMDPEDAFWTLVALAECYFSPHYFDHCLIGAQADQQVLKDMVKDKLPALYQHLESIDIELSTITLNWFLAVFFDAVPFQTLLRIWDCFLLEGPKVLFRFSLAILKLHEKDILQKTDTMGVMKHLKACAKLTYDVEGLVKLAFEGLKPFPKRKDIISKETCYLNALKEMYKKKELQRLAFAEREQMYMSMEAENGPFLGIECAVATGEGEIWFGFGDQNVGRLASVCCGSGTMTSLDFKLDSRLMCMCFLSPDEMLLGTIAWMLVSVNIHDHGQVWQIQLHDAILSVCCYDDCDVMVTRIFSGLADGTVAVTEKPYGKTEPSVDVMYIAIGQAPITCLMLLGDQLWCASGNTVAVLHAKTLDAMDIFSVSVNPYDHILSLTPSAYGIWISLRGSSILELWDPKTLNCRMLYDTRTDRCPQLRKEDDSYFNRARITSILANGSKVWVGTGEGNLMIYEVLESTQLRTPTDLSPTIETSSSMSYVTRPRKAKEMHRQGENVLLERNPHLRKVEASDSLEVAVGSLDEPIQLNLDMDCKKGNQVQGNKKFLAVHDRRRSSSENDLHAFQSSLYQADSIKMSTEELNVLRRPSSEAFLELLEKSRNVSSCEEDYLVDHAVQDEVEEELEAEARRESVSLVETEIMEKLQDRLIRRLGGRSRHGSGSRCDSDSSQASVESGRDRGVDRKSGSIRKNTKKGNNLASEPRKSVDCGWEGSFGHKFHASASSSRRSSRRGSGCSIRSKPGGNTDTEFYDAEEDPFEAQLEEQARRESLSRVDTQQQALERVRSKLDKKFENIENSYGNQEIAVFLDKVPNHFEEEKLETLARRESLLGKDLFTDDNYVSSSPSPSTTPVNNSFFTNEESEKRTTKLGMSVDSIEDAGDCIANIEKPVVKIFGASVDKDVSSSGDDLLDDMRQTNKKRANSIIDAEMNRRETSPGNFRRRSHSVIDDISILCSDCKSLKKRCKDCKHLLKSQESLKINERRLSRSDLVDGILSAKSGEVIKSMENLNHAWTSCKRNEKKWFSSSEDWRKVPSLPVLGNVSHTAFERHKDLNRQEYENTKGELNGESYDTGQMKIFPGSQTGKRDFTRQEKVGYWLNSISNQAKLSTQKQDKWDQEEESKQELTPKLGSELESKKVLPPNLGSELGNDLKVKEKVSDSNVSNFGSSKGSEEDVFFSADESCRTRTDKESADRPTTLTLLGKGKRYHRNHWKGKENCTRSRSEGSEASSGATQKSSEVLLNKKSQDAQYRLEFSNVRVETDAESEQSTHPTTVPNNFEEESHREIPKGYPNRDSRHNSLDLGHIQENCAWLNSECSKTEGHKDATNGPGNLARQKIFELLKTPSLASRHASLGLKIIDDDLEWTELFSGQCTTPSPTSTTDQRLADFLRTPSMSSKISSLWSSYDNISTPSNHDDSKLLRPTPQYRGPLSHSPSSASFGSDVDLLYNVDLKLEAKMKISDKPVKCLLSSMFHNEPIILSFSGSVGDDEAVLKWQKQENEQLWTNEPILEWCQETNTPILPTYMRRRWSSNTSCNSHYSASSDKMHGLKK